MTKKRTVNHDSVSDTDSLRTEELKESKKEHQNGIKTSRGRSRSHGRNRGRGRGRRNGSSKQIIIKLY